MTVEPVPVMKAEHGHVRLYGSPPAMLGTRYYPLSSIQYHDRTFATGAPRMMRFGGRLGVSRQLPEATPDSARQHRRTRAIAVRRPVLAANACQTVAASAPEQWVSSAGCEFTTRLLGLPEGTSRQRRRAHCRGPSGMRSWRISVSLSVAEPLNHAERFGGYFYQFFEK